MRRILLGALLFASPALAQSDAQVQGLIDTITAAGCIVHAGNEAAVLADSGLQEAEAAAIVMLLMNTGRAAPLGDDLQLTTGDCG